jgi:hypothetical protein
MRWKQQAAAHQAQVNEALGTIAEIATRTYYASKPPNALPDDVINANVMDAMIERWPSRGRLSACRATTANYWTELDRHPIEAIDTADCSRRGSIQIEMQRQSSSAWRAFLVHWLKREKDKRAKAKAQDIERDAPGRSR